MESCYKFTEEIVARLGRCKIVKFTDCIGLSDYILFCDGQFIERSWSFKKLHERMYGRKENTQRG